MHRATDRPAQEQPMIGYATLGTNDLQRSSKFYDELLSLYGAKRLMEQERFVMWGTGMDKPMLVSITPHDGKAATIGNGCMTALLATSREQVDAIYNKAIELGGTDEGAPGQRFEGFYAAYFRDLDGNKLNAFFMG
jgi:predicted lactoylglutathione lyase